MTEMHVDDIIAVCLDKDLASDLVMEKGVCTRLLGSMVVADDKTEWGIRLDILGFVIDLASRKLSIARKNFMNAIYSGSVLTDVSPQNAETCLVGESLQHDLSGHMAVRRGKRPLIYQRRQKSSLGVGEPCCAWCISTNNGSREV